MAYDIVERLRIMDAEVDSSFLRLDAIDEIERLRAERDALRGLLTGARESLAYAVGDACDEFNHECFGCQTWRLIDRIDAALGEKPWAT